MSSRAIISSTMTPLSRSCSPVHGGNILLIGTLHSSGAPYLRFNKHERFDAESGGLPFRLFWAITGPTSIASADFLSSRAASF